MTYRLSIGAVTLTVHDLDATGDFYEDVIGLHRLSGDGEVRSLGAGDRPLLHLRRDPAARRATAREAGLFHTAFLLPERGDLARWVNQAASRDLQLQGASDHIVSEALYLADPEGNGIEIYVDRPSQQWRWTDGQVEMATARLDFGKLLPEAKDETWRGAPDGTIVGHVHLQVGALPEAEAFYTQTLGLNVTSRYPGATFYSSGGYHHHIATNVWNSRNAGVRAQPSTGLSEIELIVSGEREGAGGTSLTDPWGTRLTMRSAQ